MAPLTPVSNPGQGGPPVAALPDRGRVGEVPPQLISLTNIFLCFILGKGAYATFVRDMLGFPQN